MSETSDIGARLLELRDARGWTQDKVAEEAGVSHTTVVGLETGRIKQPRTVTLRRLARAFNMDLNEFLGKGVEGPKALAPS